MPREAIGYRHQRREENQAILLPERDLEGFKGQLIDALSEVRSQSGSVLKDTNIDGITDLIGRIRETERMDDLMELMVQNHLDKILLPEPQKVLTPKRKIGFLKPGEEN